MKRALAMALGAMMVAGSAAPASAASHIDFSGYYRINYIVDNNRNYTNEKDSFTDHYFDDRLQVNLTFRPTDEIAVHWAFRGPNRDRWGTGAGTNLATRHVYGEIVQDWGTVLVGRLADDFDYYGLGSMGYVPGFGPFIQTSPFDNGAVVDGVRYNKSWDNGFGIMAGYSKVDTDAHAGWSKELTTAGNDYKFKGNKGDSDTDYDRYTVEASYLWDGGGATLGVSYERDFAGGGTFIDGNGNGLLNQGYVIHNGNVSDWFGYDSDYGFDYAGRTAFYVNPAIMHTWDNGFGIHFEGKAGWGKYKDVENWKNWKPGNPGKRQDVDADGYGAYLDIDYNYGPGNVNLAAWWVSGSDLGDTEDGGLVDFGENFYPMLVAYGGMANGNTRTDTKIRSSYQTYSGISAIGFANSGFENYIMPGFMNADAGGFLKTNLNGFTITNNDAEHFVVESAGPTDKIGSVIGGQRQLFDNGEANHWAVALTGNHAFTDDITMHYGLAYLSLVNPNYKVVKSGHMNAGVVTDQKYYEQEKDLGFEMDLGFKFQLLDNLSFNTSFGYMIAGDAYKQLRGYEYTGTANDVGDVKAKWEDGDDSYIWYNTLQFDF